MGGVDSSKSGPLSNNSSKDGVVKVKVNGDGDSKIKIKEVDMMIGEIISKVNNGLSINKSKMISHLTIIKKEAFYQSET